MKDETARRLAEAHYAVEPTIELVRRLVGTPEEEADPSQPVKLLEVNRATPEEGIYPLYFGAHPARGIDHPSVVIEVTPDEYAKIESGRMALPHGWRLDAVYARPALVG